MRRKLTEPFHIACKGWLVAILVLLAGCELPMQGVADEKFGDQNFKSAIALIELHKVRNGVYPASLRDLQYLGEWDAIWVGAVEYERTTDGYNLYVKRGWVGEPELQLPNAFRHGLGIQQTNVQWTE